MGRPLEETELVARARHGDAAAFEEFHAWARARLLRASHTRLTYGAAVVDHYHGSATISQGTAVVEGDCVIATVGGPAPGPDPAWLGSLQDSAPTLDLLEGGAWLRLADGRECEIQVERAVAGSGLTEFSGAKGIQDLH